MYRITITILTFFIINSCLKAQASIDFYPKALQLELYRTNGKNYVLKELPIHQDYTCQIFLGKFYSVSDNLTTKPNKFIYIGRVNTCRTGSCSIIDNQSNDKASEFFDYYIFFDTTLVVQHIKIYNYQATYGQEVTARSWLKQFKGYNGNTELTVGKNIDAISGATISSDAATKDIMHKTGLLGRAVISIKYNE